MLYFGRVNNIIKTMNQGTHEDKQSYSNTDESKVRIKHGRLIGSRDIINLKRTAQNICIKNSILLKRSQKQFISSKLTYL